MAKSQLNEHFCKSILQVEVPLVVTVARKRMQVDQLLKLVPGAMIQFDKPYDLPMTVELVDHPIAEGDVVKAGDKFAVRITKIQNPAERFISLTAPEASPTVR